MTPEEFADWLVLTALSTVSLSPDEKQLIAAALRLAEKVSAPKPLLPPAKIAFCAVCENNTEFCAGSSCLAGKYRALRPRIGGEEGER